VAGVVNEPGTTGPERSCGRLPGPAQLALRVLAAFVVALVVVLLLGVALRGAFSHDGPTGFDSSVTNWFVEHRSDSGTSSMRAVTWLGSASVVVPIAAVVAVAIMCVRRWWLAAFVVVGSVGAWLLSDLAKQVIDRERPPMPLRLQHPGGSAFPSGHATQAAATYLAIVFVVVALHAGRWTRLSAWAGGIVIVVAVGISRVYLGVHWATDVFAGWLLAVVWILGLRLAFGETLDV
jgi:membrane-associated phospholipid phosphatase